MSCETHAADAGEIRCLQLQEDLVQTQRQRVDAVVRGGSAEAELRSQVMEIEGQLRESAAAAAEQALALECKEREMRNLTSELVRARVSTHKAAAQAAQAEEDLGETRDKILELEEISRSLSKRQAQEAAARSAPARSEGSADRPRATGQRHVCRNKLSVVEMEAVEQAIDGGSEAALLDASALLLGDSGLSALTVRQPWARALLWRVKDVENRG